MKKILFVLLLVSPFLQTFSQSTWEGTWEGKLSMANLRLVFHITQSTDGVFSTTMDSPDQGALGLPVGVTRIFEDSIIIEAANMGIRYAGKRVGDTVINGMFEQRVHIPLQLKRKSNGSVATTSNRPQTPQPPFPYHADSIIIQNKKAGNQLGATVTYPREGKKFPAIVLISGSGAQDRDESIFAHKPYAVLADYFSQKGFLVIRYDDRGVNVSTGDFGASTSEDFADDAAAVVDYLLTRKDVDKKRIGLMGHSEGGMIAPMVANQKPEVDFVVLLAGPGVPIMQLMREQNEHLLLSSGADSADVTAYGNLYTQVMAEMFLKENAGDASRQNLLQIINNWAAQSSPSALQLTGLKDSSSRNRYIDGMMKEMQSPWMRYFMRYDPTPELQKMRAKVLALNGEKDIQVVADSNLKGIDAALKKSKSPSFQTRKMAGLNHLFQSCNECTVGEYGRLEETFSPEAMEAIYQWLKQHGFATIP